MLYVRPVEKNVTELSGTKLVSYPKFGQQKNLPLKVLLPILAPIHPLGHLSTLQSSIKMSAATAARRLSPPPAAALCPTSPSS
jgi:hypothetical protein